MQKEKIRELDKFIKPYDRARIESISMPAEYWEWVDLRAKNMGSNRSRVIRALVDYVREKEPDESQLLSV